MAAATPCRQTGTRLAVRRGHVVVPGGGGDRWVESGSATVGRAPFIADAADRVGLAAWLPRSAVGAGSSSVGIGQGDLGAATGAWRRRRPVVGVDLGGRPRSRRVAGVLRPADAEPYGGRCRARPLSRPATGVVPARPGGDRDRSPSGEWHGVSRAGRDDPDRPATARARARGVAVGRATGVVATTPRGGRQQWHSLRVCHPGCQAKRSRPRLRSAIGQPQDPTAHQEHLRVMNVATGVGDG